VDKQIAGEEGASIFAFFTKMAMLAGAITPVEVDDEREPFEWDEATVIVGAWPDRASCEAALARVLEERGANRLEAQERDCSMARVYEIATSFWISVDSELAADLVALLDEHFILGVTIVYGSSGNRAHGVELWQVEVDDEGGLVATTFLGEEDEDLDALDAALDWPRAPSTRPTPSRARSGCTSIASESLPAHGGRRHRDERGDEAHDERDEEALAKAEPARACLR
jgi:hypothetical protein